MPIYESCCTQSECLLLGKVIEHYYPKTTDNMVSCAACGQETKRMISRFGVVFTGPITTRYNDKKAENPHIEGHWAWEKRTPDGVPKQTWIETWQQRKEYMKREGLTEVGPVEGGSDGKLSSSQGLPGCWV